MGMQFQAGHFSEPTNAEDRRQLFSNSVTAVILEITGHCNRRCSYCPVSLVPRIKNKDLMDVAVLERIIRDLAAISYSGQICLNLYNEPLSDKPYLLQTVAAMRAALPNAYIYFSTNGDYLDRGYLDAVFDAGLSAMTVSIHTAPTKKYDHLEAVTRATEISAELALGITFSRVEPNDFMGKLQYERGPVTVFSRNFEQMGVDRAGSMKNVTVDHKRVSPCARPFENLTIDYRGGIFPCCQFYPDLPASDAFRTGNVMDYETIFDAYASSKMAEWRKSLFTYGDKASPCDTCLEGESSATVESVAERNALAQQFGIVPTTTATPTWRERLAGKLGI